MKILIVGGSGGIGLALVKAFLRHYPYAGVIATYHSKQPDLTNQRLQWRQLDASNEEEIERLSKQIESLTILVNAVGMLHAPDHRPEKSIKEFDPDFFHQTVSVNTLPSILLAKHFMTQLTSDDNTFFIVISARVGSISDNRLGGWLSYRSSKAALNMAIKTISIEWQRTVTNCCVLLFHPGTTDTDLSKPFQRNLAKGQLHSAEATANSLLKLIETSTVDDSGKFVSFDGSEIDW